MINEISDCARPGCEIAAKSCYFTTTKSCSIYCSENCFTLDSTAHNLIAKILKKFSVQLQSYCHVVEIIEELNRVPQNYKSERFLKHMLLYAEKQFGDRVPEKWYRERNGERITNWDVEIETFVPIYNSFIQLYSTDRSLSTVLLDNVTFPYHEKILGLLNRWSIYLDINVASEIDSLDKDQINHMLFRLSITEQEVANIHRRRNQFDLAESHCQRALLYARRYEGEFTEKTTLLLGAFKTCCDLRSAQEDYTGAAIFAEDAFNCVAKAYGPVHSEVQSASKILIECLIEKGDLHNAERYAELNLASFRDSLNEEDQPGEEVADGYFDLGRVIAEQGDLVRAEELARESLRIRVRLNTNDHFSIGHSCDLLADILQLQGKLANETKELYQRCLANSIKNEGPEGVNTIVGNFNLGGFYHKLAETQLIADTRKESLFLSKLYVKQALRICITTYGPDHPKTIQISSEFSIISKKLLEA